MGKIEKKTGIEKKTKEQLMKEELKILLEKKKELVGQVNQLQAAIRNGQDNLDLAVDAHNRVQAQIDILEKLLKD